MALSYDLLSKFAKVTKSDNKQTRTSVYGRIIKDGDSTFVKLDGSNIVTPYETTATVKDGDRVLVTIKNHTAVVTGNTSDPSASTNQVNEVKDGVLEINEIISTKITADQITAINGYFERIEAITGQYEELSAINAEIESLKSDYANIERLNSKEAEILNAKIDHLEANIGSIDILSTEDLTVINAEISQLKAYNGEFVYLSAESFKAAKAEIIVLNALKANVKELDTEKLDAKEAELLYANIDFSNIKMAAVEKLFTDSGIIKDLVVNNNRITGELVGVTIKGDLIEGNTIAAEKLVVKGSDGLYYKLNIDGLNNVGIEQSSKFELLDTKPEDWETNYKYYYLITNGNYVHVSGNEPPNWTSDTYYKLSSTYESGLDGTNIVAKSITADKVAVTDLVAFGATIGGFHITEKSIYSGAKESATNTTRGIYMDNDGQLSVGDSNNYFRYYYDSSTNKFKLEISASSIFMKASSRTLEDTLNDLKKDINNIDVGGRNLLLGTRDAVDDVGIGTGELINEIEPDPVPEPEPEPSEITGDTTGETTGDTTGETTGDTTGETTEEEVIDKTIFYMDIGTDLKGVKTNTAKSGRYMNLKSVAERSGFLKGDKLIASVYIKSDANVTGVLSLRRSNSAELEISKEFEITTSWKQYWFKFIADDYTLTSDTARIEFDSDTNENCLYWAGWKLEKGTLPTDWSPAPEDISTDLGELQQNVNESNNNFETSISENSANINNMNEEKASKEELDNINNTLEGKINNAISLVAQLENKILNAVIGGTDLTMIEQTDDTWQLNLGKYTAGVDSYLALKEQLENIDLNNIDELSKSLSNYVNDLDSLSELKEQLKDVDLSDMNNLANLAGEISQKTAYIKMTTEIRINPETNQPVLDKDGNQIMDPVMDLGSQDQNNPFKVRITNHSIDFMYNNEKIAYANNNAFYSKKLVAEEELLINNGDMAWVWMTRENGNLGLTYTKKGV